MIPGLSGSLLSHDAMKHLLESPGSLNLGHRDRAEALRRLRTWHSTVRGRIGPATGARNVFDLVAEPLTRTLGFAVLPLAADNAFVEAMLQSEGSVVAVLVVAPWGQPAGTTWRRAVHRGLAHSARWAFCITGAAVRLVDVERAYGRRYAEFDLDAALDDEEAFAAFWSVMRADAMRRGARGTAIDAVVSACERHRAEVRLSLRYGVHDAVLRLIAAFRLVASRRHADAQVLDESLIVVYRILFLLFAEARGLVPAWHPVYRDAYTIESLRKQLRRGETSTGVWESLQAVARLAHRGCRAGTLRVPPFNGRLFSPADAPLADSLPLDDGAVGQAIGALTTRKGRDGREEISYADLGVEQLGAVYEHLLDYDLAAARPGVPAVLLPTGRRKATGSFYTPRSLTEFVVRRTLAPIVHDATPEQILALRVLDPAMGSGAFLVAACRYLAIAYEHALVRDGTLTPGDISEDDRAAFRRGVAQKCLFGVDVNPMAVQLGRLSLWLATLAADRPLTFLDHHLRTGNSLVGASVDEVVRQPGPGGMGRTRELPLFEPNAFHASLQSIVGSRVTITETPDDTLEHVRGKERALSALNRPGGPVDRWKAAVDLWCAAWFGGKGPAAGRGTFQTLLDQILRHSSALPLHVADPLLAQARGTAARQRFFHWTLEFPEVFFARDGSALSEPGFDVIVANPPWEMVRDEGHASGAKDLHGFVRGAGMYTLQSRGHANLYQLFVERSVQLLKRGGRAGLILPGGFATDHAAGPLRRFLFDRTSIDTFTILDNRDGIFPIHRALKFLLMTFGYARSTRELPARSGVRAPEALDRLPDRGVDPEAIPLPRVLLERTSGAGLAVPEIRVAADLEILARVTSSVPALADPDGWFVHFGRELNATDDRPHFREGGSGLPVLEGKQISSFRVDTGSPRYRIPERVAARLLNGSQTFKRPRLAYRDVASATNRMTLISAIVPPGVVTTHTIFCLKEALDRESQEFLCGVFNSYVANYLVRMRVGTHVTTGVMARLPVPRPSVSDEDRKRVVILSRSLARAPDDERLAELNAIVARLYQLTRSHFARILETFPLIPAAARSAALQWFEPRPER